MPIVEPCPLCDLGLLRADRIEGAFECDMCGAQLPALPPRPRAVPDIVQRTDAFIADYRRTA